MLSRMTLATMGVVVRNRQTQGDDAGFQLSQPSLSRLTQLCGGVGQSSAALDFTPCSADEAGVDSVNRSASGPDERVYIPPEVGALGGLRWWTLDMAERLRGLVLGAGSWRAVTGPSLFATLAIALLVYDHFHQRVNNLVFWLTVALVASLFVRMLGTIRRQSEVLQREHESKLSDRVTGLQTRDRLRADLREAFAAPDEIRVLVLLELDGLQAYNDRFGYTAGDEVLRRFAQGLVDSVTPLGGTAYRSDGSRLAALVPAGGRQLGEVVLAATASLREEDSDAVSGPFYGEVAVPAEAGDPDLAFRIASQRLAAHKQGQHRSARRQAHAVLIGVVTARHPERANHLRMIAYRAISLARRLGVDGEEIEDIALAGELQKIGLMGVPEAVQESGLPLGAAEIKMVRNHTVEGERIIGAAPGLASVARLVRSSSEHFDGSGCPDGLAGEAIPLGARIIAVSVAFVAITSPRPHRPRRTVEEALAELRRHSGSQFDPRVVDALAADLAEEASAGSS
jgi:HD-GYP domain-containing protein (c-di-GMP phosphodiesterase class II)